MEIYNVGRDELCDWDFKHLEEQGNYKWFVYSYAQDSYDGCGEAIGLREDGLLDVFYLGHCSCYGPLEEPPTRAKITIEEFSREKDSVHDFACDNKDVEAKVWSLLWNL